MTSPARPLFLFLLAFVAGLLWPAEASAVKVRVRGGSTIKLVAVESGDDVTLRGQVTDDLGASIGRIGVRLEAVDAGGRGVRMGTPRPCAGDDAIGSARADGDAFVITTDERGAFCVKKPGGATGLQFRAKFVGNNLNEGTDLLVAPTPEGEQRAQTVLKFESPPTTLDLDKDATNVSVSLRIDREDAARLLTSATKREGLPVVLKDERGEVLARATTGGDGRARFDLAHPSLAGPGNGELIAEFAGDRQLAPSKTSAFVTRVATARLGTPDGVRGDPDAGISVVVDVSWRGGDVDGGIIEAVLGGASVGAGPVERGKATVVVSFAGGAAATVPVTLRYVPAAPFFQAGPSTTVDVQVEGPSPLRQLVLAAVGLGLAAWIVTKWRRAPKGERADSLLPPPPSGRPEILVLERPSGLKGWRGIVADAHEGFPIEGAELRVVVPAFDGRGVLARTRTGADGTFALELEAPRDARLIVEGDLHATYEQPLPSPSVLRVALVTRRRALLDTLVRWARRRGMPFDSSKEPTPGHVRRVAGRTGSPQVETWATKLEHAAFGPGPVTRSVEEEVASAEPGGQAADGPPRPRAR